jgi:hypothetical protein
MGNKTKHKLCYFCGKPAVSKGHVPPIAMFKPFTCSRITVPSCDDHNSQKSGNDQDIVHSFLLTLKQDVRYYAGNSDIHRAIEAVESSFKYTHRHMCLEPFIYDLPHDMQHMPNLVRLYGVKRAFPWVRQITAGLVYSATQQYDPNMDWLMARVWSPSYYESSGPLSFAQASTLSLTYHIWETRYQRFRWFHGWSAKPVPYPYAIYHFDVQFRDDGIAFRHVFYQHFVVYVEFTPTELMRAVLRRWLFTAVRTSNDVDIAGI